MAQAGDSYVVELKPSHLDWGRYRHTQTRDAIAGEGYVKIPRAKAEEYGIYLGNTYIAVFSDGFPSFSIRAAGNSYAGDIYAKQFQGDGDLKAFGRWYASCGAKVGDRVRVKFITPQKIEFTLL